MTARIFKVSAASSVIGIDLVRAMVMRTLREVRRVLKPGGSLHLLDFGGPESGQKGFLAHLFHTSHSLKDNSDSRIIELMSQAGLANPEVVRHGVMLFGKIAYYQASAIPYP